MYVHFLITSLDSSMILLSVWSYASKYVYFAKVNKEPLENGSVLCLFVGRLPIYTIDWD
jgi:hypothetical protein